MLKGPVFISMMTTVHIITNNLSSTTKVSLDVGNLTTSLFASEFGIRYDAYHDSIIDHMLGSLV